MIHGHERQPIIVITTFIGRTLSPTGFGPYAQQRWAAISK